jgi:hypothetical protein
MSRQYLMDVLADPPLASGTAIVATTETSLFATSQYAPIPIGDMRAGKIYKISAGGIYSTSTSGTLIITPRFGTSTSGVSLGASPTITVPVSQTNVPWYLEYTCVVRTMGLAGTNSTVIGNGVFVGNGSGSANAAFAIAFGGISASVDATIAQGINLGWTLSVAGSCTPQWCALQSLN